MTTKIGRLKYLKVRFAIMLRSIANKVFNQERKKV